MKKIPSYKPGPPPLSASSAGREVRGPQKFRPAPGSIPILGIFCRFLLFMVDILGVMGPFLAQTFLAQTLGPGGTKMAKIGV